MGDVYKILESLLQERGISGGKMSADLGMSRSFMTELRKGRAKSITADTAQKIANYFGVSVEYLLGQETKKAPTNESERTITADDFTYAMYSETKDLSPETKERILQMARFFAEEERKKGK